MTGGRKDTVTSEATVAPVGLHTQFKNNLKIELHSRLGKTVKARAGKSFDERLNEASKRMQEQQFKQEQEQRRTLTQCVEKGRSRPTSAPTRRLCDNPDREAMLRERKKRMKEDELAYAEHLMAIKDRMDRREPLFRLSDVHAAFEMQKERQAEHRQELMEEEHARWEHLREIEESAFKRPLLLEDMSYKKPKGDVVRKTGDKEETQICGRMGPMLGREEYEIDQRLQAAVSRTSFLNSEWAQKVRSIREGVARRPKLHEVTYPPKAGLSCLAQSRMMHSFVA